MNIQQYRATSHKKANQIEEYIDKLKGEVHHSEEYSAKRLEKGIIIVKYLDARIKDLLTIDVSEEVNKNLITLTN